MVGVCGGEGGYRIERHGSSKWVLSLEESGVWCFLAE
jgi:hypothetical protein